MDRVPARVASASPTPPDGGRRTPFGWPVARVDALEPVRLDWPSVPVGAAWLRLTIALEVWQTTSLVVRSGDGAAVLGELDLDHCDVFEVLDLPLTAQEVATVVAHGIRLELAGGEPIWIFAPGDARMPLEFQPHLLVRGDGAVDPVGSYLQGMASLASLQQFSWKEGCVLDGLLTLARAEVPGDFIGAIDAHLAQYLQGEHLVYEDPWGRPTDDAVYGIEGTLPFAIIATRQPLHPVLDLMLDYVAATTEEDGSIIDLEMVSAEGSYTVAYPLAVLAAQGRPELAALAVRQLLVRRDHLAVGDDIYLRAYQTGAMTYRNWARGYTWYLLGLAKTLRELGEFAERAELERELLRVATIVEAQQLPDGLWRTFAGEPATGTDTSGSAGIATAFVIGHRMGVLPVAMLHAAVRARDAALAHLTADGLLGGVTQANKDGERLQRRDYRVLSQMGAGLLAQLIGELAHVERGAD